eukprot:TRINITY_DN39700_c0_g1_i1.p1 TRINITY_DN39700_c0_g1~~TRINITY_DN39700_c0_g1_i1.p1  ORF type:complete len:106 (-),score=12.36 TRINITY_DN39700_c0_g1_i1:576-893(-)
MAAAAAAIVLRKKREDGSTSQANTAKNDPFNLGPAKKASPRHAENPDPFNLMQKKTTHHSSGAHHTSHSHSSGQSSGTHSLFGAARRVMHQVKNSGSTGPQGAAK